MTDHRVPALMGKATYHLHPDDTDAYKAIVARMAAHGSRSPWLSVLQRPPRTPGTPTIFYLFEGWDGDESAAAVSRHRRLPSSLTGRDGAADHRSRG